MKDRRFLLLALVPAVIGAVAALLLASGVLPNPLQRLVILSERSGLLLLAGALLSLVLAVGLGGLWLGGVWGWRRGAIDRMALTRDAGEFYGRLDHEIKNPLQAIYSSLENIGRQERLSPQGQALLRTAYSQIIRLRRLIEGLRKVAGLPTRPVEARDLDMAEVVYGAVTAIRERYADQVGRGGERLVLHLDRTRWQLLTVHGDIDLLSQAVHNVIENAFKFSPPEAPIEVWCIPDGDWVRVKVADQGLGIPAEDLPRLGEELFRGATARSVPGHGLGLALVKGILDRHNGDFQVESKVGQGTTVSLLLPRLGRLPVKEKKR